MTAVAVIAANLAAGRAISLGRMAHVEGFLFSIGPMFVCFQLAILQVVKGPIGARSFWAGFALSSALAMGLAAWLMIGAPHQQWLAMTWMRISSAIVPRAARADDRLVLGVLWIVLWLIPQLVLSAAGGTLFTAVRGWYGSSRRRQPASNGVSRP